MDNAYLNGPQGSMLNIGSWFQADSPPDYGAHDLQTQIYNQNAMVDGGQFSYEFAGVRRMSFPLLVASGGAGLSLDSIEAWLRTMARPGAFIDLQPDGVATAEMVRFDVLGGRVNHDAWSLPLQRIDRRKLTLALDVQPYGYWPTWITLASVASAAAAPGIHKQLLAASVIGDMPADVRMVARQVAITPASAPAVSQDFLAWGIGAGVQAFGGGLSLPGGSYVATNITDSSASFISGVVTRAFAKDGDNWGRIGYQAIDQSYRGRHRVLMYARFGGSSMPGAAPRVAIDVVQRDTSVAFASAAPIATLIGVATLAGASSFALYDLGDVTFPVIAASYATFSDSMRVWMAGGSAATTGIGTAVVDIAGFALLPLESTGFVARGLSQPTVAATALNTYDVMVDSTRRMIGFRSHNNSSLDVDNQDPWIDGMRYFSGRFPQLGASDVYLNIVAESRISGTSLLASSPSLNPPVRRDHFAIGYSVAYQPRFAFLKGL